MATYGLMFDNEYCTGCHSCEVACRNELGLPRGQWGIKLLELGPWRKLDNRFETKFVPVPTTYCDMCEERVAKGKMPMCVQHCQAWCMYHGEVEDLVKKMGDGKRWSLYCVE